MSQDHEALLKAKHCPRVAQHHAHRNPRDLDLWTRTVKLNSVLEIAELHVRAKYHQAECSGSW